MAWLGSCWTGSARPRTRASSSTRLRFEIGAQEVYVFTPKGDVSRCRPARRPSTSPTPSTPRSATARMGAQVNGRLVPLESTLDNGDVVEIFTSKADGAGPEPGLAHLRQEPAGPQQDPAVVHQGAPRGGDRAGQGRHRAAMRKQNLPMQRLMTPASRWSAARARAALPRRLGAVRGGRRGPRRRRSVVQRAGRSRSAARRAPRRTWPRSPPRPGPARPRDGDPGVLVRGATTSGSSSPSAARRCPATRSSASSRAERASRCTAPTAATCSRCCTSPSG